MAAIQTPALIFSLCSFHRTPQLRDDKLLLLIVALDYADDAAAAAAAACRMRALLLAPAASSLPVSAKRRGASWPVLSAVNPACSALSKLLFEQWSCLLVC